MHTLWSQEKMTFMLPVKLRFGDNSVLLTNQTSVFC